MRKSNMFWGIVIILTGGFLLVNQIVPGLQLDRFFWPIVLVFIGLWMLLKPILFKRKLSDESISIPIEGAPAADIRLSHGAGRLEVASFDSLTELVSGSCYGGVDQDIERHGNKVKLNLKTPSNFFDASNMHGLDWKLNLTRSIPISLDYKGGANEVFMDLTDLQLTSLKIETGASSTRVQLPSRAGYTRVDIRAGAASVDVFFPDDVAGRITAKGGLASINVDSIRFPSRDGIYQSADYDTSTNKIEIDVSAGVGSINIK